MRLNRLHMRNFRQHLDTEIEFDSGLTGIIGPNGSGKSTILEAVAWALYGMPAARGTREGIRSLRAPARASVKVDLDFDLAGHRYLVSRTLTSAELYLDGAASPIANSISSVTDLIRRRLGMTQQEFFNTYFTGQKELSIMAAMGPAERAQFLSRVLGYERLRSAQGIVRDRRNVIKGELAGLTGAMPDSETVARVLEDSGKRLAEAELSAKDALRKLKKANDAVLAIKPRWDEAQKERDALKEIVAELRVRESEEGSAAREVERLDRELAEIADAKNDIEKIKAELHVHSDLAARLAEMERLSREEGRRREMVQSRAALELELARLRDRASRTAEASARLVPAGEERERLRLERESAATRAEAARTEWVRDQQEASTKLEAHRATYLEIRQQRDRLADLGPESPCPICTRPLSDHFREVLDDLDGKLTAVQVDGRYFAARVEQLASMPAAVRELEELETRLTAEYERASAVVSDLNVQSQEHLRVMGELREKEARLQQLVSDLESIPTGYHVAHHAQLRQRHAQLAPMVARSERLGALIERHPQVEKNLRAARRKLETARTRIEDLRKRQKATKFSEATFTDLSREFEAARALLRTVELDGVAASKELEAARAVRASAEAARAELARAQERLRSLTSDRRLHEELDRAFTDMRAELNQHLRPEISELASNFLGELTDGRYGELELDDDYNIIVLEDAVPKPVISGGEEDLANLVLRLAISQMIAERAGQAFSLLILDEIFGSLDESRRHNVVELLRRLHDRFEQVILITHVESVREGLDRVITVRYDEESGSSRVEEQAASDSEEESADEYAEAGAGD